MAPEEPVLAITNASIHPVRESMLERGTLLIQGGRITALGVDVAIPAGARVLDAAGKHVYPGLIALGTNIGMKEIGSVPATDDDSERGGNQPDLRTAASIHGDSAHIPVTRTNGITRAQVAPRGSGPLLGQSAVIQLSGANWEEFVSMDRDMLHVRFPFAPNEREDKERKPSEAVKALRRLFAEAREYGRLLDLSATDPSARPEYEPRLEAMVPFARGQRPVALHADNAQTILEALRFAREEKLDAVLNGVAEGWKVADVIAREGRPVVVGPVLALPTQRDDPYDAAYANAAVLSRAGVSIAIKSADDENPRNLAFHAAMAACFGLPREEALRAITLYPARILKLDTDVGSLAPGMVADLIITDGDVLELTSRVEQVFIAGRQQDLSNRQSELYERYRQRVLDWKASKGK
jgi:imidazolonepropionase-like amidohydrolase